MTAQIDEPRSGLVDVTARVSDSLARRISRRSFLARTTRTAIAVVMGSAGASRVLADPAAAHTGGCGSCGGSCCGANSVLCQNLPGHMQNSCPGQTVNCGYWEVNDSSCASGRRRYIDCCGGCAGGSNCTCINGAPSCCRHKTYPQQQGTCSDHIKCRRHHCVTT